MFGLGLEKVIVIGFVLAFLVGPERIPVYVERLREFIEQYKAFAWRIRQEAGDSVGIPLDSQGWNEKIRHYDPRAIIEDAWEKASDDPTVEMHWEIVGGSSGHPTRRLVPNRKPADGESGS